jgi:hypothetical protein
MAGARAPNSLVRMLFRAEVELLVCSRFLLCGLLWRSVEYNDIRDVGAGAVAAALVHVTQLQELGSVACRAAMSPLR